MDKKLMVTHEKFVEGYQKGKYLVYVNKYKAGDFVMSKPADKHNKPAHLFWTWAGILLVFPVSLILLFSFLWLSLLLFFIGIFIINSSRKSAEQFVIQNMVDDKYFWEYVLMYNGAIIRDNDGKEITFAL